MKASLSAAGVDFAIYQDVLIEPTDRSLQVFDVAGRLVTTLVNEPRGAGRYSATWNGVDASGARVGSGVYFYRLSAGNGSLTRKMVLLK